MHFEIKQFLHIYHGRKLKLMRKEGKKISEESKYKNIISQIIYFKKSEK
jgi:hypothetical protein